MRRQTEPGLLEPVLRTNSLSTLVKLPTPCGPAWGHDGGVPSHASISLTSPNGLRQAVVMLTREANTWTDQIRADYASAVLTAFCGQAFSTTAARPLAAAMARGLASLHQRPR
jgi:hypothetical protein